MGPSLAAFAGEMLSTGRTSEFEICEANGALSVHSSSVLRTDQRPGWIRGVGILLPRQLQQDLPHLGEQGQSFMLLVLHELFSGPKRVNDLSDHFEIPVLGVQRRLHQHRGTRQHEGLPFQFEHLQRRHHDELPGVPGKFQDTGFHIVAQIAELLEIGEHPADIFSQIVEFLGRRHILESFWERATARPIGG